MEKRWPDEGLKDKTATFAVDTLSLHYRYGVLQCYISRGKIIYSFFD